MSGAAGLPCIILFLAAKDGALEVSSFSVNGDPRPGYATQISLQELSVFTAAVETAVKKNRSYQELSAEIRDSCRSLSNRLLVGDLRGELARLSDVQLLLKLFIPTGNPILANTPWEALYLPGEDLHLATDSRILLVRHTKAPRWLTDQPPARQLPSDAKMKLLGISAEATLDSVQMILTDNIQRGKIELLPPLLGVLATPEDLISRLHADPPHVLHFIGHGAASSSGTTIRLVGRAEQWIEFPASLLGQALKQLQGGVRLIFLESCDGSKSVDSGSAAELLGQQGAQAVISFGCQIDSRQGERAAQKFYEALVMGAAAGDVAASLAVARQMLATELPGVAFMLRLHLSGYQTRLFEFKNAPPRDVQAPPVLRRSTMGGVQTARQSARIGLPADVYSLLRKPFSLVLGDMSGELFNHREQLRGQMVKRLESNVLHLSEALGSPLNAVAQRHWMQYGDAAFRRVFHDLFPQSARPPVPDYISALARRLSPGIHVTLLWFPLLEQALIDHHSQTPGLLKPRIYVVQAAIGPGERSHLSEYDFTYREWLQPADSIHEFDFSRDFLLLRMYRGQTADGTMPLSPLLTEDDHLQSIDGIFSPFIENIDDFLLHIRDVPALAVGISAREWAHRWLLGWLFDRKKFPKGSVAILDTEAPVREQQSWWQQGGWLVDSRGLGIHAVSTAQLTHWLAAFSGSERVP